jgi:hypothetical protein
MMVIALTIRHNLPYTFYWLRGQADNFRPKASSSSAITSAHVLPVCSLASAMAFSSKYAGVILLRTSWRLKNSRKFLTAFKFEHLHDLIFGDDAGFIRFNSCELHHPARQWRGSAVSDVRCHGFGNALNHLFHKITFLQAYIAMDALCNK